MNATGKPDALQVDFECLEFLAFSVAFIVQINGFQCFSDAKVVLSLLVERDISSHQGSLSQAENIQFLVERQVLKSFQLIAEHLDVGESLIRVHITFCHVIIVCYYRKSTTIILYFKLFWLLFLLLSVENDYSPDFLVTLQEYRTKK